MRRQSVIAGWRLSFNNLKKYVSRCNFLTPIGVIPHRLIINHFILKIKE